jgi:hypothetical protein
MEFEMPGFAVSFEWRSAGPEAFVNCKGCGVYLKRAKI